MMSLLEKFAKDLRLSGQDGLADFVLKNDNPEIKKLFEQQMAGKRYLALCKTCSKVFVDMPFNEYYKAHTFPEWDVWFCDAVLHWATHKGLHYIYVFGPTANYDLSGNLAFDCRNETWEQILGDMKDVEVMREGFLKRPEKCVKWIQEAQQP